MYAAADIAVACVGAIPQLGFVHESSGHAFALDIADLFRSEITLPIAFEAARKCQRRSDFEPEPTTRRLAAKRMRRDKVIPNMIDKIKRVLDGDDHRSHT
jgi:CRISPR-associated protein Cas1